MRVMLGAPSIRGKRCGPTSCIGLVYIGLRRRLLHGSRQQRGHFARQRQGQLWARSHARRQDLVQWVQLQLLVHILLLLLQRRRSVLVVIGTAAPLEHAAVQRRLHLLVLLRGALLRRHGLLLLLGWLLLGLLLLGAAGRGQGRRDDAEAAVGGVFGAGGEHAAVADVEDHFQGQVEFFAEVHDDVGATFGPEAEVLVLTAMLKNNEDDSRDDGPLRVDGHSRLGRDALVAKERGLVGVHDHFIAGKLVREPTRRTEDALDDDRPRFTVLSMPTIILSRVKQMSPADTPFHLRQLDVAQVEMTNKEHNKLVSIIITGGSAGGIASVDHGWRLYVVSLQTAVNPGTLGLVVEAGASGDARAARLGAVAQVLARVREEDGLALAVGARVERDALRLARRELPGLGPQGQHQDAERCPARPLTHPCSRAPGSFDSYRHGMLSRLTVRSTLRKILTCNFALKQFLTLKIDNFHLNL
ncbi:unnamed protein product [Notodromas monacha]|uniref:Uncharacterized protein n=1 Tax=Notodromas monacha TaxID=399045 RepID=A0A7R9BG75_9CRUS|nr:unnamed protein product [Notodromas monacha]CAG0913279.1 unnamed protein product [Notodromas monacha]